MDKGLRLCFCRGDLLAVGLVLCVAALLSLGLLTQALATEEVAAQLYLDGQQVAELPLDKDAVLEVTGAYVNTVTVRDGAVAVTQSDCPGADCVHSGWTRAAGRALVCLPNRMEIRLTGLSDVDIAVG